MVDPPRGASGACHGRRRRVGRPWASLLAGALLLGIVALPAAAATDVSPDEEADPRAELREAADEAREHLRTADERLAVARAGTRGARAAGTAADGAVRAAEEQVVPALLVRSEAEGRVERAGVRLRVLRRDLRESGAELEVAREQLADRVVRAYKQGSVAAEMALPLLAAGEADSPGELARALKSLEVLALTGAVEVDDLDARIAWLGAELHETAQDLETARRDLDEARTLVDGSEATATARRRTAAAAEARLLQAAEREIEAEAARAEAHQQLVDALEELGRQPSPGSGEGVESDGESRLDHLRGRQRAHARQLSLPEDRRRVADDWVCPVDGSRFVNDWAFPRTEYRRHEGTDVFAPMGTRVLAVADGVVTAVNRVDRFNGRGGLGGLTVSFERGDERFYNAHLDAVHPAMAPGREIEAGDVIGWVGRTGNARGTPPHLHFGWYVDDVAANPYGSLAVACHG